MADSIATHSSRHWLSQLTLWESGACG